MASPVLWLFYSLGGCLLARAQEHDVRRHDFSDKSGSATSLHDDSEPELTSPLTKWQDSHAPDKPPRAVPPEDILRLLQRGPAAPHDDEQQQGSAKGGGHPLQLLSESLDEGDFPPHFLATNALGVKAGAAAADFSWQQSHFDEPRDFEDGEPLDEDDEEEEEDGDEEEEDGGGGEDEQEGDDEEHGGGGDEEEELERGEDGEMGEEEEEEDEHQTGGVSTHVDATSPYGGEPQDESTLSPDAHPHEDEEENEEEEDDEEEEEDAAEPPRTPPPESLPSTASPDDEQAFASTHASTHGESAESAESAGGATSPELPAVTGQQQQQQPSTRWHDSVTGPAEATSETFATDRGHNNGGSDDGGGGDENDTREEDEEEEDDDDGEEEEEEEHKEDENIDEDYGEKYPTLAMPTAARSGVEEATVEPGVWAPEEPVGSALPTHAAAEEEEEEELPNVHTAFEVEGQRGEPTQQPPPPPPPPCPGSGCSSDEHGTIIAIIVTVLCAALVVAVIGVWCYKKRQQQHSSTFHLNGKGQSRQRENIEMQQTV